MSGPVILHVAAVEFTASRLLQPQLAHLADLGYEVHLACRPDGAAFSEGLRAFHPLSVSFPRSLEPLAMARATVDLRRVVHRVQPELIHFHSPAASVPGRVVLVPNRRRPRVVYTVHGFLHTWKSRSVRDRALEGAERLLSRWTDALLFQSAEDHKHAERAGYRGRLAYIGNGVSDEWFECGTANMRQGPLHAVYVGRLTREKGVGVLLSATRGLPDVRWTVVGDALVSDRDSVAADVAAAARESNGRIRWVGMVTPDCVRRELAEADLLVLPSWREGVPRSVIEGMAAGLPVIATDIRGCRELVEPGVNGWLVPARDPAALARAIAEAAALPGPTLTAMGAAGRAKAWEHYREQAVFERIAQVYRTLGIAA